MSNDVLITPASRKIEFKDSSGNVDAVIQTDSSGNLSITNTGGDLSLGDTTSDVFIGDGTNNIDLVFEQNGEIRGTSGVTVTVGASGSTINLTGTVQLDGIPLTSHVSINAQTGTTYTLVLSDQTKLVTADNSSAITITVPPNSSVAYPIGTKIDLLAKGAGQVTVAAGSGVTVNTAQTLKLRRQWSGASLIKLATNTWVIVGDLEAT